LTLVDDRSPIVHRCAYHQRRSNTGFTSMGKCHQRLQSIAGRRSTARIAVMGRAAIRRSFIQ